MVVVGGKILRAGCAVSVSCVCVLCLVASGLLLAPRGSCMGFWRVLGVWVACGCGAGVTVREGRVGAP